MAEPVDPVGDYLSTRGTARACTLSVYDPARDAGGADPYAAPVPVRASQGDERTAGDAAGDATTTTWTVGPPTPDVPLARPALRSRLTSRGRAWVIDRITASPAGGRLFVCECTLATPP